MRMRWVWVAVIAAGIVIDVLAFLAIRQAVAMFVGFLLMALTL